MKKKGKILVGVLLIIIIALIVLVVLMFNQNSKLNKMSEVKEQLSTEDGIISTSEHLSQIEEINKSNVVSIPLISSGYNYSASNDGGELFRINTSKFTTMSIGSFIFSQTNNMGISIYGVKDSTDTLIANTKSSITTTSSYDITNYAQVYIMLNKGTTSSETMSLKDIIFK